jgi:hypothetical protein
MNAYEAIAAYKRGEKIDPNELTARPEDIDSLSPEEQDLWMKAMHGPKPKITVKSTKAVTPGSRILDER